MAMSLADELGDELDAHLADNLAGTGLGQSLADELDQDLAFGNGDEDTDQTPTPSLLRPTRSTRSLRNHGLPMNRNVSGNVMSSRKVSATSTYYTAEASPGRLSALDSGDEIDQQLYELSDDDDEGEGEGHDSIMQDGTESWDGGRGRSPDGMDGMEGAMDLSRQFSINSAGLPTPTRKDDDMIQVIQEQADDQARFLVLLSTVLPNRIPIQPPQPITLTHSLNRSTNTGPPGLEQVDEILARHVERLDEGRTVRELQLKDLEGIRLNVDRTRASGTRLDPEVLGDMLDLLGDEEPHENGVDIPDSPLTVMATPTLGAYDSPTIPSPHRLYDRNDFPFDHHHHHDQNNLNGLLDPKLNLDPDDDQYIDELSRAIRGVIDINQKVISDCTSLSESAHLHSQFLLSTSRQLKGLKGTVAGWKDREMMEDNARSALEEWERSQVERGLRGEMGTREVIDGILKGFQEVLGDCDSKIKDMRSRSIREAVPSAV